MTVLDPPSLSRALAENRLDWSDPDVRATFDALRRDRDFATLAELAEKAARFAPHEPTLRRLQAQALIDSGQPATALSVIDACSVAEGHVEHAELEGLRGRAYKQMFVDAGDGGGTARDTLLAAATAAYLRIYEADRRRYWHGINLLALECAARRGAPADTRLRALANELAASAGAAAEASDDPWAHATVAEACVGLGDIAGAEKAMHRLLGAKSLTAFHVGSVLRQLVQVWRLDRRDDPWRGLVTALRAKHALMPGADATLLRAEDVRYQRGDDGALPVQFERILGRDAGLVTYDWWKLALQRTLGVAAVRDGRDCTIGTAFAVDGGSLVAKWAGRTLLLTNYHVVNRAGLAGGLRPEDAELVFEAIDRNVRYGIAKVLWESPREEFDCAILLPDAPPAGTGAMPLARRLPAIDAASATRVFIIGHPNGRGLEFSINDNQLLCHDGDAAGAVTRLHYRAPTEPGSSGSPVFREGNLEAVAIHHGYTRTPLDGRAGPYEANEGIGLQSLRARLGAIEAELPDLDAP
jgi:hypothetical protein